MYWPVGEVWKTVVGVMSVVGVHVSEWAYGPTDYKLVILHVNDLHSRVEPTDVSGNNCKAGSSCFGGFARVKRAADLERARYEADGWNVIFLNAGDMFQGTPYFTVHGSSVFESLMPIFKLDASSLGNHEFDNGPGFLANYLQHLQKNHIGEPILCSNADATQEKDFDGYEWAKSIIINKGGRNIGIIGYLTPLTKILSNTGKVILEDETTAIAREVKKLKQETNIIIALGHSGHPRDVEIAASVIDLDVVVGGHTNTFLYNGVQPSNEPIEGPYPVWVDGRRSNKEGGTFPIKVPVVQAGCYTKYMGVLQLIFDREGLVTSAFGNAVLLTDQTYGQDLEMKTAIVPWQEGVENAMKVIIGKSQGVLDGEGASCRHRECSLGNLVADAFIEFFLSQEASALKKETLISFFHSGSIRASLPAGEVSFGHLLIAFPFSNEVKAVKLKGETIRKCLEHSVSTFKPPEWNRLGNYLQMAGIKATYDFSKPVGKRLVSAQIRCDSERQSSQEAQCGRNNGYSPLVLSKTYYVITASEILNGMDGFEVLKNEHTVVEMWGRSEQDIVKWYLETKKEVQPQLEERSVFIGN